MKKLIIVLAIVAAIVLVGAFVPLVNAEFRHTETYLEDEPYEATETYYEDEALAYGVVESYTDTGSYKERRRVVIGGVVFQDEIVQVFYPIGCVRLQNQDDVAGTFAVRFTFHSMDRSSAAQLCHPGFDFEDYLAAQNQEAYLHALDWDELDLECLVFFADKYDGERQLPLDPGQTDTVKYSGQDVDMDVNAWKWEYTVTEPTKEVEKERTVTKYRQVEKERLVIRYERVPIFSYLRSRF